MKPETLAKDILQVTGISRQVKLVKNETDLLRKHCISTAVSYAKTRHNQLESGNTAFDALFGDTNSKKFDATYSDVAKIVCDDKVIDALVELLKN